ncbi:MAG TPA: hypothetical protein DCQ26_03740 [Marinilabiliales bacterium]|nr:MAG: hypothetical protein A2W95_12380 [Bacteroidetes bacterium GWA2_40_14]OFX58990.1 MAG: hypothetical protein A2W84_00090 [Bacteroidetes bacterium GWC2_40_13]OFX71374.1 MAG: hypothetical protein A2W96_14550 [Bacteroidetes bacterium GWD2_40_43]OFX91431.1 MAG: hypothetical protein A2W97_04305 [Bacteroidetes bacterium GWE2_40_63]OFY19500.1 MAG: hypothetical protein A2W88_02185 [Bacteroidetes bacterium GWF2_40_13]OFZ25650.1 MAG: hypothetical protein A2437_12590 [Bacteroidetes bacterium RIFOXYC
MAFTFILGLTIKFIFSHLLLKHFISGEWSIVLPKLSLVEKILLPASTQVILTRKNKKPVFELKIKNHLKTIGMKTKFLKSKIFPKLLMLGLLIQVLTVQLSFGQDQIPSETIRGYVKREVLPTIKPYRADFEKSLTAEEKKQIEQIRADLKEVRTQRQDLGLKGPSSLWKTALTDEQVNVMKTTRDKAFKSLLQVAAIASNHEQELNQIFEEQKNNRNLWTKEINQIVSEEHPLLKNRYRHHFFRNIQHLLPAEQFGRLAFIIWNPEM